MNVTITNIFYQMQATGEAADSGIGMLMNLRKCANHPLLIRDQYDDRKLEVGESDIAVRKSEQNISGHRQTSEDTGLWPQTGAGILHR